MENAVIYARYSSHGQNEQTIEGQVRICRELAENKGEWTVAFVEAKSALLRSTKKNKSRTTWFCSKT